MESSFGRRRDEEAGRARSNGGSDDTQRKLGATTCGDQTARFRKEAERTLSPLSKKERGPRIPRGAASDPSDASTAATTPSAVMEHGSLFAIRAGADRSRDIDRFPGGRRRHSTDASTTTKSAKRFSTAVSSFTRETNRGIFRRDRQRDEAFAPFLVLRGAFSPFASRKDRMRGPRRSIRKSRDSISSRIDFVSERNSCRVDTKRVLIAANDSGPFTSPV